MNGKSASRWYKWQSPVVCFILFFIFQWILNFVLLLIAEYAEFISTSFWVMVIVMVAVALNAEIYTSIEARKNKDYFSNQEESFINRGDSFSFRFSRYSEKQMSNYCGRKLYKLMELYFGFGKSCLSAHFSLRPSTGIIFELSYRDILDIEYVPELWAGLFYGKFPGARIVFNGASCVACRELESSVLGRKSLTVRCDVEHMLELCIVRGGTHFAARMSQAESYRRFEEFRDRVMEMKRLTSEG